MQFDAEAGGGGDRPVQQLSLLVHGQAAPVLVHPAVKAEVVAEVNNRVDLVGVNLEVPALDKERRAHPQLGERGEDPRQRLQSGGVNPVGATGRPPYFTRSVASWLSPSKLGIST